MTALVRSGKAPQPIDELSWRIDPNDPLSEQFLDDLVLREIATLAVSRLEQNDQGTPIIVEWPRDDKDWDALRLSRLAEATIWLLNKKWQINATVEKQFVRSTKKNHIRLEMSYLVF